MGGYGEEAQPIQLLLDLPLGLVVARRGRSVRIAGVDVEVAEESKEGGLLGLGLLEVLALDRFHIEPSLGLMLSRGVLALVGIMLVGGVLVLLGAVGDEVVGVAIVEAALLVATMPAVHEVVVEPREPADDQR